MWLTNYNKYQRGKILPSEWLLLGSNPKMRPAGFIEGQIHDKMKYILEVKFQKLFVAHW